MRNRIIAGILPGVVIVEEQTIPRIADYGAAGDGIWQAGVPGNVTEEVSLAPNQLIKQGAKRVTNAEDVIEERPTRQERLWCRQRRWGRSSEICWQRTG